jgi:hypothetical protein
MSIEKKTRRTKVLIPPFQSGQIWQMGDANLEIGLVGKRLVHYKHYKIQAKRPPTQLSSKGTLERFLQKRRASLLRQTPEPNTATEGKPKRGVAGKQTGGENSQAVKKPRP